MQQEDGQTSQDTDQLVTTAGLGPWTDEETPSFTVKRNEFSGVSWNLISFAQVWELLLLRGTDNLHRPGAQLATAPAPHAVNCIVLPRVCRLSRWTHSKTTDILLPCDLTGPNFKRLTSYTGQSMPFTTFLKNPLGFIVFCGSAVCCRQWPRIT